MKIEDVYNQEKLVAIIGIIGAPFPSSRRYIGICDGFNIKMVENIIKNYYNQEIITYIPEDIKESEWMELLKKDITMIFDYLQPADFLNKWNNEEFISELFKFINEEFIEYIIKFWDRTLLFARDIKENEALKANYKGILNELIIREIIE